jgi:hypothetical protein
METLPPIPTILQNHVNMAETIPVEEPKMVKPSETIEMSVDDIANAESSDMEEQNTNDVTMDVDAPTTELNELIEEAPTPVKKSTKFNPELVFTLTHMKTGDVMEVTGGVPFVVEKLSDLGLKASSSACNNAIKGVTKSHCGYTISCNQPLKKRVKKTKKGKKKTSPKKKATKKTSSKRKTSQKKKSRKVVKKVNKKKATKKAKKKIQKGCEKSQQEEKSNQKGKKKLKKSGEKSQQEEKGNQKGKKSYEEIQQKNV